MTVRSADENLPFKNKRSGQPHDFTQIMLYVLIEGWIAKPRSSEIVNRAQCSMFVHGSYPVSRVNAASRPIHRRRKPKRIASAHASAGALPWRTR